MIKLFCAILYINVKDDIERLERIEIFINYLKGLEDDETVYILSKYASKWKKLRDVDTSIEELKKYRSIDLVIGLLEKNDEVDFSQSIGMTIYIFDSSNIYVGRGGVPPNKDNICLDYHRTLFDKFVNAGVVDSYTLH